MITSEIEVITPAKAERYIKSNTVNRTINQKRVSAYAYDMKMGAWQTNGEGIRFDENGKLIDGQHRLSAIILANVPVKMMVTKGISKNITIYDRGRNRAEHDSLQMAGYSKKVANKDTVAMTKLHYYIQAHLGNVSHLEIEKFLKEHEHSIEIVRDVFSKSGSVSVNVKNAIFMLAGLYAYESGVSESTLKEFAGVVSTGFYESKQDAAIVLRNDILSKRLILGGNGEARIKGCYAIEKAICDFNQRYTRKKSYSSIKEPTFSNNQIFRVGGRT